MNPTKLFFLFLFLSGHNVSAETFSQPLKELSIKCDAGTITLEPSQTPETTVDYTLNGPAEDFSVSVKNEGSKLMVEAKKKSSASKTTLDLKITGNFFETAHIMLEQGVLKTNLSGCDLTLSMGQGILSAKNLTKSLHASVGQGTLNVQYAKAQDPTSVDLKIGQGIAKLTFPKDTSLSFEKKDHLMSKTESDFPNTPNGHIKLTHAIGQGSMTIKAQE